MDVWKELKVHEVELLRQRFEAKHNQALTLPEFVNAFLDAVCELQNLPPALYKQVVAQLSDLFHRIDVNADEKMEWEEFTAFMCENSNLVLADRYDGCTGGKRWATWH